MVSLGITERVFLALPHRGSTVPQPQGRRAFASSRHVLPMPCTTHQTIPVGYSVRGGIFLGSNGSVGSPTIHSGALHDLLGRITIAVVDLGKKNTRVD